MRFWMPHRTARRRLGALAAQLRAAPTAYGGPDGADLHHAAVAAGAIELDTGSPRLLARIEAKVGVLTFNSPERKNSLGDDFSPFLRAMIAQMRDDDRVRCLLLTGAGDAFCSGGNVKSMAGDDSDSSDAPLPVTSRTDWTGAPLGDGEEVPDDPNATQKLKQATLTGALFEMPKPTIAALPGAAAGAGMSIALACDFRLGAENAFITTGFRNVGLSGDYGGTWLLTQLVGPAIAKQLYFTAERVQSDELLRLGEDLPSPHARPRAERTCRWFAGRHREQGLSGRVAARGGIRDGCAHRRRPALRHPRHEGQPERGDRRDLLPGGPGWRGGEALAGGPRAAAGGDQRVCGEAHAQLRLIVI